MSAVRASTLTISKPSPRVAAHRAMMMLPEAVSRMLRTGTSVRADTSAREPCNRRSRAKSMMMRLPAPCPIMAAKAAPEALDRASSQCSHGPMPVPTAL